MKAIKKSKKVMLLFLSLIILLTIFLTTFAWFTDTKHAGDLDLNFGEVSLVVDDTTTEDKSSTTLCLSVLRDSNNDGIYENLNAVNGTYKILPGDKIGVKLRISLNTNSQDAYYLVKINSSEQSLFSSSFNRSYFMNNGTLNYVVTEDDNVVVYNAETNQKVTDNNIVGQLTQQENTHTLTLSQNIDSSLTKENLQDIINNKIKVICEVKAIQKANITQALAYEKLSSAQVNLAGKRVSILGDSISTYRGYSNNPDYNSTLSENNLPHYPDYNTTLGTVENTWLKQVINSYDMQLCVDNSQGGSTIAVSYDSRSMQLHNDHTNKNPDIIFVYMGVNDINRNGTNKPLSEIDFDSLITKNGDSYSYKSTTDFSELYAIMVHKMMIKYNSVDIFLLNLPKSPLATASEAKAQYRVNFNEIVKFLSEKYDLGYVDLDATEISTTTQNEYLNDSVHPKKAGMDIMANAVKQSIENYYKFR